MAEGPSNLPAGFLTTDDLQLVLNAAWDARCKWYNIGIQLGINSSDLDAIKMRCHDDPDNCFRELIKNWLRGNNPRPTWSAIATALRARSVGFEQITVKIESQHTNMLGYQSEETGTEVEDNDNQSEETRTKVEDDDIFRCPCGRCSLESYLDRGCQRSDLNINLFPYLNIANLDEDSRDDLIQVLTNDLTEIMKCFADLLDRTAVSVGNYGEPTAIVQRLIVRALSLGAYESPSIQKPLLKEDEIELRCSNSVDEAFIILRRHMSFFNFELLQHIINCEELCTNDDRQRMEKYCDKFDTFCRRKVFEVPPDVYGQPRSDCKRKSFVVLMTKHESEPNLVCVRAAKQKIATILKLKSSTLHLHRIDEGSLLLVFSIPEFVAQHLFPLDNLLKATLKAQGCTIFSTVSSKPLSQNEETPLMERLCCVTTADHSYYSAIDVGASKSVDNEPMNKVNECNSSINPNSTKQNSAKKKPHNPRKRGRSCSTSKVTTEHDRGITRSTIDHIPSTLRVCAIQTNFPDHISEKHLRQHFSKYETYILYATILRTSMNKRYGLITFSSYEIAENARKAFRGQLLLGCLTQLDHYAVQNECLAATRHTFQRPSKVTGFVPSIMTGSQTTTSGKQSSINSLDPASKETFTTSSSDSAKSTLLVEGIRSKLPDSISDGDLMKHFSAFSDDIVSTSIGRDPQTNLGKGYGIVTFSSSETAMKAKKKYNGTHLCRKYQLRVTVMNPVSLTPSVMSTVLSAKSDEDIEASSSNNDKSSLEHDPARTSAGVKLYLTYLKNKEPQISDGCDDSYNCFVSEADVPNSMNINPSKTKEPSSSAAGTLIVGNLSCLVDESELKALISSCGAEVSSCTIAPNPVALGICTANVSLVDCSQVEKVIEQLNEKEVYKCKLEVHSTEKKHVEPLLHVEKRKISLQLFQFITKHSHDKIELFKQKGGAFDYQELEKSAVISSPDESVVMEFLLWVFNKYSEKTIKFNRTKWYQLTLVRDKPNLLSRTESQFSAEADIHIIPQIDKHKIHFVGTHEGVTMTSSWLNKQLDQMDQEIEVESDKMEALITIYPTLDSELSDRYHIKVLNYSQDSTVFEFAGNAENVQKACQEIEALIAKFGVAEVPIEHSSILLDSAQKRIKESELEVSLKIPTIASRSKSMCLTVSSFCPKHHEKAVAILKGRPTYKSLKIPGDFNIGSAKLKRIVTSISKECQVSIRPIYKQKTCTSLLLSSFVRDDISTAYKKLQEQLFSECMTDTSVKPKATAQDIKEPCNLSSKEHVSSMEHDLNKPDKSSNKHLIKVRRKLCSESCCRAFVTLSNEIIYYIMQNRNDWFTEITKNCMSINVPEKVHLASAKCLSSDRVYVFEGKIGVVDKVIEEIKSLARIFCAEVVWLNLPTENVRLMQSRWRQFKENNEAMYNVCIDFTLPSPILHSTSKKEVSTVIFTLCGTNVEQVTTVMQNLQINESGLNLPIQETVLTVNQLKVLNSLIAKDQLNFGKYPIIVRVIPESQSLILKAASKQTLDKAYRDILTLLGSSVSSHVESAVSLKYESSECSQSLASSLPTSIEHCTLWFEPHYIPLFLSQNFVETTSQFEKAHGVRVMSISENLVNNTVKQVIFKSSCGNLITVQLCYSNLLYEKVDAIVNSSHKLSHNMKAIGGEVLQLELDSYIAHHQAVAVTDICACLESGNLPCSKIIHVISFSQDETGPNNFTLVQRALECAQEHNLTRISFPFVSMDVASAENLVYNLQKYFVQNPSSCVYMVRIVCSSERYINAYNSVKEFDSKSTVVDLPKLEAMKPPRMISSQHIDCQWYWQADDGTFIPYSEDINKTLSFKHKLNPTGRCFFQIGSNHYIANFERMEQSNMSTRFVRKMKIEYVNPKKVTGSSHVKPGLRVSVKWLQHSKGKESSPYSATDSALIEKLYFSSSESFTLEVNLTKFLFDFKAMQKQALQQALPSEKIHIQRKVIVHQLTKPHSQSSPKWYYMDDTKQFKSYSNQDSTSIEGMYQSKATSTLSINSKTYTFDFNDMKQINVATKFKRSIKRLLKSSVDVPSQSHCVPLHCIYRGIVLNLEGPSISQKVREEFKVKIEGMVHTSELPLPLRITTFADSKARILNVAKKYNIECTIVSKPSESDVESKVLKLSGAESLTQKAIKEVMEELVSDSQSSPAIAVQIPAEWQSQTKNTQLFELSKSSDEYSHIESMFHSTMSTSSTAILSIKRIQNNWLWEKYVVTRNRISKKNNGKVNEKELFHGSRMRRAHYIYDSEEGFDMRYSSEGMWGQANYFAEKASYSNSYACELTDGNREILLAKVLTGDSYKCASDRKLRLPPLKGAQTHLKFHQERYDTVEGETGGSKVYMTYSNDKAYPAYLIVYNPNYNILSGMWRSSSSQPAAAAQTSTSPSWNYNLTPNSSTQSSSTPASAAASPSTNSSTNHQRSHLPQNTASQPTPPKVNPTSSEQKRCSLQ